METTPASRASVPRVPAAAPPENPVLRAAEEIARQVQDDLSVEMMNAPPDTFDQLLRVCPLSDTARIQHATRSNALMYAFDVDGKLSTAQEATMAILVLRRSGRNGKNTYQKAHLYSRPS